jgi:DNA polymerase I-like protein with 3'-5' exonuclease and polymerase domains
LDPDVRELLNERRKAKKKAEADFAFAREYEQLEKKVSAFQVKIEKDKSGLIFHQNILGLVQIGTETTQYLFDPNVLDDRFKELLRTREMLIGTNLKFDLLQLAWHLGIYFHDTDVILYDIILADKMINSGRVRSFSLKSMAARHLNYQQSKEEQLSNWLKRPLTEEQLQYGAMDVITPGLIKKEIEALLHEDPDLVECCKLQMDFLKVLAEMELNGIYVDLEGTQKLIDECNFISDSMRYEIAEELGDEVWVNPETQSNEIRVNKDLGSAKETLRQLKEYGKKHDIPVLEKLTSTSIQAFEEIEEVIPIVEKITEFRSLHKVKASYCESFFKYHVDSRIHSSFVQLQKEGTRMSSKSPNVQNISQPGEWDRANETFEEVFAKWTPKEKLRAMFPAAPGKKLFDADYGAIELCMVAYYSQDVSMLKALHDGVDLHAFTANHIFQLGYSYDDLRDKKKVKEFKIKYKRERQIAKTFNFAVVYGAGAAKLIKQLYKAKIFNLSETEVNELKNYWYDLYPMVKTWQESTLHVAKHLGFCTTRMGRKIYFDEQLRVYSKAFNTPIQASCFEALQRAAVIFTRKIRYYEAEGIIPKGSIKLVNLIHDEFLVETSNNISDASVIKLINESMLEGMVPLMEEVINEDGIKTHERVPVSVDCARVDNWAHK